ncbi:AzlC family ABC transporter permease [Ruminococcus sp.]|uniref:AzlC family ABC transporter permease n=1 Tax=Ruminococcus sp. TaxID=41978 RepID=UPI003F11876A
MGKRTLKKAFKDSLPILAGYLALGIGFGVLLHSKGYSFLWALLMSCTIYAGAGQYAAVDLLSSGASLITTAVMTLIINARHFFYGFSLLDKYKGTGKAKPYMIFALTDETYSLVCTAKIPDGIDEKKYYLFLSVLDQLYWITGCTIGALLGTFIPFDSTGIDFAMTALFVVIFVEQWLSTKEHLPAILGAATTLVCLFIFGAQYFIIPSMAFIAVELVIFRKRFEKSHSDSEETDAEVSENG